MNCVQFRSADGSVEVMVPSAGAQVKDAREFDPGGLDLRDYRVGVTPVSLRVGVGKRRQSLDC